MSEIQNNFLTKGSRPEFLFNSYSNGNSETAGSVFVNSNEFKNYLDSGQKVSNKVEIPTKALLGSTTAGGRLLGDTTYVNTPVGPLGNRLTLRQLLNVQSTQNNMIEYMRETGYTNAATTVAEGSDKPESAITFEEKSSKVVTLAHVLPVTKQILADVPSMKNYIDTRLIYGLRDVEEQQILFGSGTGENLTGIMVDPAVQDVGTMPATGTTMIDFIRKAITQAILSGFPPTGIVLNPTNWEQIEISKGTDGHYIFMSVGTGGDMRMFRIPVIESVNMPLNDFLLGSFGLGAQVYDREQASVQVSDSHLDFFIKNKLMLLAEERLAMTIQRPESFVKGKFA